MYGVTPEEKIGIQRFVDTLHPEDRAFVGRAPR
jgi:hypothetical protein